MSFSSQSAMYIEIHLRAMAHYLYWLETSSSRDEEEIQNVRQAMYFSFGKIKDTREVI